jgi:KDO2-lipid IV(A) lauroyltransferase
MDAISFYLFYGFNWVITLLPFRALYVISDFLFLFLYYFPGYRKGVVMNNLKNAFPEKSDAERAVIGRKFYRHLADIFIETLKQQHLSVKEHKKRFITENPEVLERLYSEGKDVVAVFGHYNNWEYTSIFPLMFKYVFIPVYRPLKNKYFDKYLLNIRERYGSILTPGPMVIREILKQRKENRRSFTSLLTDQIPAKGDIHYWTQFLNQDTPVYLGAEKIAAKYGMAVVFLNYRKVKRGHYSLKFEVLFENAAGLPEYTVTEAHVKRLEEIIREAPEYWIWSHRRWKHKREQANG